MEPKPTTAGNHWNAYWSASDASRAAVTGDAPGDLFDSLWCTFFESALLGSDKARLIDLACGAGVVLERAMNAAPASAGLFCGLDYSRAAAAVINTKTLSTKARAHGVTASAADVPFADGSFDLVVSQFGLEYAGERAFAEAARILAPGGQGQLLVHYEGGGIYVECADNLEIIDGIRDAALIDHARGLFSSSPDESEKALAQQIAALRRRFSNSPARSAKTTLERLSSDLSRIALRRVNYDPPEVLDWFDAMEGEISSYRDRMRAMTQAALDKATIQEVIASMTAQGVEVAEPEVLTPSGASNPAAWRIQFKR